MTTFDIAKLVDVGALRAGLLYPYQSDGVAFLLSKKRAVLGDDMGLGKPASRIWHPLYRTTAGNAGRPPPRQDGLRRLCKERRDQQFTGSLERGSLGLDRLA